MAVPVLVLGDLMGSTKLLPRQYKVTAYRLKASSHAHALTAQSLRATLPQSQNGLSQSRESRRRVWRQTHLRGTAVCTPASMTRSFVVSMGGWGLPSRCTGFSQQPRQAQCNLECNHTAVQLRVRMCAMVVCTYCSTSAFLGRIDGNDNSYSSSAGTALRHLKLSEQLPCGVKALLFALIGPLKGVRHPAPQRP